MIDQFIRRKKQQFMKYDRSMKQSWDDKISKLCEKINSKDNYYTTSSCSGRVVILIDDQEKRDDLFLFVSHDLIEFDELTKKIDVIKDKSFGLIYLKHDPAILHIACRSLDDAQRLHDLAKESGWKRCGIITSGKRFIVEINGSEKLEFPLIYKNNLLVDGNFLKLIVKESNKKLKISWDMIQRLTKAL